MGQVIALVLRPPRRARGPASGRRRRAARPRSSAASPCTTRRAPGPRAPTARCFGRATAAGSGRRWPSPAARSSTSATSRSSRTTTVLLLAAGPGELSRIYRTTDDGKTWTLVHTNPDKDGFYDAIAFWDDEARSRPRRSGRTADFVVRLTTDGGLTWAPPPPGAMSEAFPGEGAFAASGTCLSVLKGSLQGWFVTGGARMSRVFRTFDRGRILELGAQSSSRRQRVFGTLLGRVSRCARPDSPSAATTRSPRSRRLNGTRSEDGGRTWKPAPVSESGFYLRRRRRARECRRAWSPSARPAPPSATTAGRRGERSTRRPSTPSRSPTRTPAGPSGPRGRSCGFGRFPRTRASFYESNGFSTRRNAYFRKPRSFV